MTLEAIAERLRETEAVGAELRSQLHEAIKDARANGVSVIEIANQTGLSRNGVYLILAS